MTAFTGAGISTGSGIPDYRSGANTVISTGPGCWETAANIEAAKKAGKVIKHIPKSRFEVTIAEAKPNVTHLAMKALSDAGKLKHIISQNVDGLHRKSGIPAKQLTEVHGNMCVEICEKCENEYLRE